MRLSRPSTQRPGLIVLALRRRRLPHWLRGSTPSYGPLLAVALGLVLGAAGAGGVTESEEGPPAAAVTDLAARGGARAAVWSLSADQQRIVGSRGYPDSFTILGVDGAPLEPERRYRLETWNYHAAGEAEVFIDGEHLGVTVLEWTAPGSGSSTSLRPEDFAVGMTVRELESRILGSGLVLDVSATSGEYSPAAVEGLQLGFEAGSLVYVDTSPDLDVEPWAGGGS